MTSHRPHPSPRRVKHSWVLFASLVSVFFTGLGSANALAEEASFPIQISDARSHPNLGVPVGVVYLTLHNTGDRDDRLVRIETNVAKMVELHESLESDGMMRMKHHPDGFEIAAGQRVELAPGGKHVMLMQLEGKLEEGGEIPLVLVFEHAGRLELRVPIVPRSP